jgi:chromosome segregation protein
VHLSAITLRGFKSFPDRVEVKLEPGVAVVVGPNGSGKSNVADAIVWAAGSLSPSELRAEKPDDVLFAGGGDRSPGDFCEIELHFDNSSGEGPVDYSELTVARRLHRGGEGQYLLNGTAVRRIDLVELLADLGLGGGMHSIIGQGKVEEILGSSPVKRRELVEEAAGLGRFKRRRHRAELKLARVSLQVERARDVEEEVRKRLRPLALQATAAERAEKLAGEVASLRARIAAIDLADAEVRRDDAHARRTAAGMARRRVDARLEALLAERGRAEEELADAAGRREAATATLYRVRSTAERLAVRRESASVLRERLAAELAESDEPAEEGVALAAAREVAREASTAAVAAFAARESAAARARALLGGLAATERAARAEAHERLEAVLAERLSTEQRLAAGEEARNAVLTSLVAVRGASERISVRHESASGLTDAWRRDLAESRALSARGPAAAELERAAAEGAAGARSAASERDALLEEARLARERLTTLERSLAEREGIPPAARALAEAGERLALSALDVEPGCERAVAAALGPRASAVLAGTAEAGLELLERARRDGLGGLRVLVGREPADLVAELPIVEREELLASSVPAVTLEGFGYDPARGELWFVGEAAEAVLLELDARRAALSAEADELDNRVRTATAAARDAATRAVAAEAAWAEIEPRARRLPADEGALEKLVAAAARLADLLGAAATAAARIEGPLRARAEASSSEAREAADGLRALGEGEASLRRETHALAERANDVEGRLARLGGSAGEVSAQAVSPTEVADAEAALERARQAADEAAERARQAEAAYSGLAPARRAPARAALRSLLSGVDRLDEALGIAVATAARLESPLRARVDAGSLRAGELAGELRRLGGEEVEIRRAAGEAAEHAAAIDVELARIEADASEAGRRLEEAGAEPAGGDDRSELAERVERLERRRLQLGQVNPFAQEEYEREKERLEELAAQRADLEASLKELDRLRTDLTETVERRFAETFAAVASHFEDVAATLFPGGEGRLRLTEADPDEEEAAAGIEVELRPAGKRITRLSLLSGGEKALGAISFLFALFLARPCPFYLLDEVEAALDDTNIGRFVELLRRYADRTQFVVITHQKRTMEAADVLYGVTMGDDGVSQLVSRRLPREDARELATA